MKQLIYTCAALATAALLQACSCSGGERGVEVTEHSLTIDTMEVAPRDSDLYEMGRRHAAYIINNHTHPDSIGKQLLEIRARETEIRRRVDETASRTYIYGVERYIRENSPELADSIL